MQLKALFIVFFVLPLGLLGQPKPELSATNENILFFAVSASPSLDSFKESNKTVFPEAIYSVHQESALLGQSNLPIIIINTLGQQIPDEPRIRCHMGIIDNQQAVNSTTDPFNGYDGSITIEIRGSSSQMFEKKNFGFETQTDTGTNLNVPLLGMPEENDWVLHGPYSDKSLMRNALTYQLGNLAGSWAPRCRFCELYINNSYSGVYVLMEKIKIDKNRLAIANLKPEDISGDELTGGYLLKIDRPEEGYWVSPYLSNNGWSNIQISYADPEYSEMLPVQRNYIKNYVTSFENALHGSSFKDPTTGYRAFIDVQSFVDFYLINELSKNVDAYRLSTFFYKDKDSKGGKLKMGPLWDFNLSFGNADYYNCQYTDGWFADGMSSGDSWQPPFWWQRLREDPYFNAQLAIRWFSLRKTVFSDISIENCIDSIANLLDAAQQRNFQQFPVLNQYVWPNSYIGGSYNNEINFLKDWTFDRLSWMDSQLGLINSVEELEESFAGASIAYPYPNPFSESLVFRINLKQKATITLLIVNLTGTTLVLETIELEEGSNEIPIETTNFGKQAGIFLYELSIDGNRVKSGKLVYTD